MQSKRSISTETGGKWRWHFSFAKARKLGQLFDKIGCEAIMGKPDSGSHTYLKFGSEAKPTICFSYSENNANRPQLSGRKLRLVLKAREIAINRGNRKGGVKVHA